MKPNCVLIRFEWQYRCSDEIVNKQRLFDISIEHKQFQLNKEMYTLYMKIQNFGEKYTIFIMHYCIIWSFDVKWTKISKAGTWIISDFDETFPDERYIWDVILKISAYTDNPFKSYGTSKLAWQGFIQALVYLRSKLNLKMSFETQSFKPKSKK